MKAYRLFTTCVLPFLVLACSVMAQCKTIYVRTDGNDAADGSTWELAKKTVTQGIAAAVSGDEIWVAKGTYSEQVTLKSGIALYGGFLGDENTIQQRPPMAYNITDINASVLMPGVKGSIILANGADQCIIDGFVFRNGVGTSVYTSNGRWMRGNWESGGAIQAISSALEVRRSLFYQNFGMRGGAIYLDNCNTDIVDCAFEFNSADAGSAVFAVGGTYTASRNIMQKNITGSGGGGTIFADGSNGTVESNTFTENTSRRNGGALIAIFSNTTIKNNMIEGNEVQACGGAIDIGIDGTAIIRGNIIRKNTAGYAGGIWIDGIPFFVATSNLSVVVSGNIIAENTAQVSGGAVSIWRDAHVSLTNNTVVNNDAAKGGAIHVYSADCTAANNILAFNNSGILSESSTASFTNNCFFGNTAYNYSGLSAGATDISADPFFVDRVKGDYHLKPNSPCINAGWNDALALPLVDIDGQSRVIGGKVDIGVDEYVPTGDMKSIFGAKKADADSWVELTGDTVTGKFGDAFYIENSKRTSGIRVENTGNSLQVNQKAHVFGKVQTNAQGELYVDASVAQRDGEETEVVKPLFLINSSVGGGSFGLQEGVWGWNLVKRKRVYTLEEGLSNIGLLVKTSGKVIERDQSVPSMWFKIDDGSWNPVKCVLADGLTLSPHARHVTVTGISSCEKVVNDLSRLLRVRSQDDIQVKSIIME